MEQLDALVDPGLLPEAGALAERAASEFTAGEERNPTLGVLQAAPKAGSAGPPSNSRHSGGSHGCGAAGRGGYGATK